MFGVRNAWKEFIAEIDEILHENVRLKSENNELRELVRRIWNVARLMQANEHITGMRITDEFRSECEVKFAKLGIDVDEPLEDDE